jgi:hypothetical protein
MFDIEFRRNIADAVVDRKPTAAERFAHVVALLYFEYDLEPDVRAEAERLLRAFSSEGPELNSEKTEVSSALGQDGKVVA